ncbi:MAG: hypothetical protein OEL88_01300 [Sterolibacteriaceae bacterium MAG5]|nr:hypothetical protein [Candidatus Nitricoxidireducens bremensis]
MTQDGRRGEKIGWTVGWTGGFAWLFALACLQLFQGHLRQGLAGLALSGAAVFCILAFAPWRHPTTPLWKLMVPIYLVLFVAVGWAVWIYGGFRTLGLDAWSLLWMAPLLIPLGTSGRRTWQGNDAPPKAAP